MERLYGIEHGNNQFDRTTQNAKPSFTQEDLAAKLGMSVDTLQNYKALADMIPELDDMVRDGTLKVPSFRSNRQTVSQLKKSGVAVDTKTEIYNTKDKIKK